MNRIPPTNVQQMPYGGVIDQDACKVLSRKIMSSYDVHKKGFIDPTDTVNMIKDCYRAINTQIQPNQREIAGFIKTLNGSTNNQKITPQDIESYVKRMLSGQSYSFQKQIEIRQPSYVEDRLEIARRLFKKLDQDGSGYITEENVYEIIRDTYRQMGMKYEPTADDVRSWIVMTDSDGDGKVTLQDYENLVLKSLQTQAISYNTY